MNDKPDKAPAKNGRTSSYVPGLSAKLLLLTILFGSATALAYGLLGGFSDLLFGFIGTAVLILVPLLLALAKLLTRIIGGLGGTALASQFLVVGLLYPCLAGLDSDRQTLYLNLCAIGFLGFIAWLLATRLLHRQPESTTVVTAQPA